MENGAFTVKLAVAMSTVVLQYADWQVYLMEQD